MFINKQKQKLRRVLEGIPEELHDILVTSITDEDILKLEVATAYLRRREVIRNKVMAAQRKCGLPLEPNASVSRVEMKIRLKKRLKELRNLMTLNRENDESEV